MPQSYWAAGDDAANAVMDRVRTYYSHVRKAGWLDLWRKLNQQYYAGARGGSISREGEQGELSKVQANDFASLLQRKHVMTSSQKLNLEARAQNTDYKSQARTVVANSYLENCQEEKRYAGLANDTLESCLLYGEGDLVLSWNQSIGPVAGVDPETGQQVHAGDLEIGHAGPLDSIRDPGKVNGRSHAWRTVRGFANKYDLGARFPELADAVCAMSPDYSDDECPLMVNQPEEYDSDDIPVYTFLHAKTPALPQGRIMMLAAADCVLLDGPLPYDELPVYSLAAQRVKDTPFGYSLSFDLLGLQDAITGLISIILTNQSTFGVQNLWFPPGASIKPSDVIGALNEIHSPVEPKALNLCSTPQEIFKFIDMLRGIMETLIGVNSVARGNPEANLKSGAALALVAAQAMEFNARLQTAYADFLAASGSGILKIASQNIAVPRLVNIAGKSQRAYAKEVTGADFEGIKVYVDMGSAMLRSSAGRMEVATTLLQTVDPTTGAPMVENAQQYLQVLATGKLEPLTENQQAELLYIRAENEALMEGDEPEVLITDNDALHILEQRVLLFDPEARKDPALVQRVLTHLQEHVMNMQTKDPTLAMALKHAPPAPPMMPGMPPGMPPPANEPGMPANQPMPGGEMGGEMDAMGQAKPELPAPAEPPPIPAVN